VRRSRFRDQKGNFLGWGRLVRHGPHAFVSTLLRMGLDYRPQRPWISYSAAAEIERRLTRESRVLEFGSGMSTLWFARRAGEVFSVENDPKWYEKVRGILGRRGLDNVRCELRQDPQEYSSFPPDPGPGFDVILVDGRHRKSCVASSSRFLKPGGILYLDNSDMGHSDPSRDLRRAEQAALEFARSRSAQVTYFTDFAPTQFFVEQGLMVRLEG
jgi:predicted O-methyltransferase YrrM